MTDWEREQEEYVQRQADAMDAGELLFVFLCGIVAIGCWHFLVEWAFGMFP